MWRLVALAVLCVCVRAERQWVGTSDSSLLLKLTGRCPSDCTWDSVVPAQTCVEPWEHICSGVLKLSGASLVCDDPSDSGYAAWPHAWRAVLCTQQALTVTAEQRRWRVSEGATLVLVYIFGPLLLAQLLFVLCRACVPRLIAKVNYRRIRNDDYELEL